MNHRLYKNKRSVKLAMLLLLTTVASSAQQKEQEVPSLFNKSDSVPLTVIRSTREFRERLLSDPWRPAFHFSFPEDDGRPGDPNGAFYYGGLYHLMYLYKKTGSGFAWGHVSSPDMLHWRHHPDAIEPGNGDEGCFSGGAYVDSLGKAYLSYWMLWGAKGIGIAQSTDADFNQWQKLPQNPVIASTEWGITEMKDEAGKPIHVGSADPSNIWRKDGKYYMLTGNLLVLNKYGRAADAPKEERGDRLFLFESDDLKSWKYQGRFYERNPSWTDDSEDNMCPSFFPLPAGPDGGKQSGKHLLLFISHNKGCQYYTGRYTGNRFLPEKHGRMTWKDNAFFAPEALTDDKGRQVMWSWIFDDRPDSVKHFYGWTGMYSIPRSLWMDAEGTLRMQPIREMEALRGPKTTLADVKVSSGEPVKLNLPENDLMEIQLNVTPIAQGKVGVKVKCSEDGREETAIWYDAKDGTLNVDAGKSSITTGRRILETAPLQLKKGEPLKLRIFIDKGIIEVFANDRQAIGRAIYPTLNGNGVQLFAEGGTAVFSKPQAWKLFPANPY